MKDVQAIKEAFMSSNHKISSIFLWDIFAILDPDPYDQNQCGFIRIHKT